MNSNSSLRFQQSMIAALTLFLFGCGGGGGGSSPPPNTPTQASESQTSSPIGNFSSATLLGTISASSIASALPANSGIKPLYAVDAYKLTYTTTDAAGQQVLASGLVAIPRKATGAGASPVLAYQHATIKTDAEAPSNHATSDEPAIMFASLGYLVAAADYVGYGTTKGQPHPYLLAAPTAASVIDFISASNRWRQSQAILDNGQLFLTGYSEGAYASMAALRQMTQSRKGTLPVATFVGAGPYSATRSLSDMSDAVSAKSPIIGALIKPGFMKLLGAGQRASVRNALLSVVLGEDSDIKWSGTVLDNYLDDNTEAVVAYSNVYDWAPQSPVIFFHGRDDTTVFYANTDLAYSAMSARGAQAQLERMDCPAKPAGHISCVPYFLLADVQRLGAVAKGL